MMPELPRWPFEDEHEKCEANGPCLRSWEVLEPVRRPSARTQQASQGWIGKDMGDELFGGGIYSRHEQVRGLKDSGHGASSRHEQVRGFEDPGRGARSRHEQVQRFGSEGRGMQSRQEHQEEAHTPAQERLMWLEKEMQRLKDAMRPQEGGLVGKYWREPFAKGSNFGIEGASGLLKEEGQRLGSLSRGAHEGDRASVHDGRYGGDRAMERDGDHREDRAFLHGGDRDQDRAFLLHGERQGRDRASRHGELWNQIKTLNNLDVKNKKDKEKKEIR